MSNFSFRFTLLKILSNFPILQYFVFFKESQFKDWEEMQTQQAQLHAEVQTAISIRVSHAIQHWQPAASHSCEELCLGKWWKASQSRNQNTESIQNVEKQLFSPTVRPGCERISSSNDLFQGFILSKPNNSWEHKDLCYSSDKDEQTLHPSITGLVNTVQTWSSVARCKSLL